MRNDNAYTLGEQLADAETENAVLRLIVEDFRARNARLLLMIEAASVATRSIASQLETVAGDAAMERMP